MQEPLEKQGPGKAELNRMRALLQREESFLAIVEASSEGIWFLDNMGVTTYANPAMAELLETTQEEMIGVSVLDFIEPAFRDRLRNLFLQIKKGRKESYEFSFIRKNSKEHLQAIVASTALYDRKGEFLGTAGMITDITEMKRFQEALSLSENRFRNLLENLSMAAFQANSKGFIQYRNRAHKQIIPGDDTGRDKESWVNLWVHEEDRQRVKEEWTRIFQERKTESRFECRVLGQDGRTRIMAWSIGLFQDPVGDETLAACLGEDVTEKKEKEERLLIASKVYENSIEGIIVTDTNSSIQYVNPAFTHITGYSGSEAIGRNASFLKSHYHSQEFYSGMWESITSTGSWQGEIWNRKKNGELYPQWMSINSIRDDSHRVVMYSAVFNDMTEQKRSSEKLEYQYTHDLLTGLPNRNLFLDRLDMAINHAKRKESMFAVMFLDLDNFKSVNDSMGHMIGDRILLHVSDILKTIIRDEDTLARQSGDEFIILVDEIESPDVSIQVARRILAGLTEPVEIDGMSFFLSASIGITLYPVDGQEKESLMKNADLAMFQAKEHGRGQYRLYTQSMNEILNRKLSLENDLRKAIEMGELFVVYQPKVSTRSCKIVGMEALLRWNRNGSEVVSPEEFIPLAEESSLIYKLGLWILRESCRFTRALLTEGYELKLSVNISGKQMDQPGLTGLIKEILNETGLPGENLCLEITESSLMKNPENAIKVMESLVQVGVQWSLDDFGTGYSSLGHLRTYHFNELKMDRSFIDDLEHDTEEQALVNAVIDMAHALGMKVTAEGVESEGELHYLENRGCDEIQGYFYSAPIKGERFRQLLDVDLKSRADNRCGSCD